MTPSHRLAINTTDVVHEAMDGEVIVVNLKTGRYYSLAEAGSLIWNGVEHRLTVSEIEAVIESRYMAERSAIAAAVANFLAELETEGLIRIDASVPAPAPSPSPAPVQERASFAPPVLVKHVDMEGLLLLDPVHEVSPDGWPSQTP